MNPELQVYYTIHGISSFAYINQKGLFRENFLLVQSNTFENIYCAAFLILTFLRFVLTREDICI